MKRYIAILITLFSIFTFGCSTNRYIELPYSIQHAYANNDVIDILNGNKSYNTEKLEEFISCVENGEKKNIRIVSFRVGMNNKFDWNKPQHIYDLSFDGKNINLIIYSTYKEASNGKIIKTSSSRYTKIDKVTTNEDITYKLVGRKEIIILSLVKNGFIDNETQKYLDSILNKK